MVVVGGIGDGDSRTIDSKWVASMAVAAKNPRGRQRQRLGTRQSATWVDSALLPLHAAAAAVQRVVVVPPLRTEDEELQCLAAVSNVDPRKATAAPPRIAVHVEMNSTSEQS
jgi:hypothetical protein